MKKILTIVGVIALLLVLLIASVGVWAYYEFLYTQPLDEQELAELEIDWDKATGGNWSPWWDRGDGTMEWNPSASYNEWVMSIPDEDKAWAGVVDLYYKHHQFLRESEDIYLFPPEMRDWDGLKRYLIDAGAHGDAEVALELFSRAQLGAPMYAADGFGTTGYYSNATHDRVVFDAMERWGVENPRLLTTAGSNPSLLGYQIESLSITRGASRIVLADALMQLEAGQIDAWLERMDAVSRAGELVDEIPIAITQLTSRAFVAGVNRHIAYALQTEGERFSDAQLAAVDQILARHQFRGFVWEGEAMSFNDTIRRMCDKSGNYYASDLAALGNMNPGMVEPCHLPDDELDATAQRLIHINITDLRSIDSAIPWVPSAAFDMETELKKVPYLARMMSEMLITNASMFGNSFRAHRQETIGLRLVVAMYRHRLRHGDFPGSIQEIDSELMATEPLDAFGGLLCTVVDERGLVVYSKSDDRDDDLGAGMQEYDIDALLEPDTGTQSMSKYRGYLKESTGDRSYPLWVSDERFAEIEAVEPRAIDGDWVLFPIQLSAPEQDDEFEQYEDESDATTIPEED